MGDGGHGDFAVCLLLFLCFLLCCCFRLIAFPLGYHIHLPRSWFTARWFTRFVLRIDDQTRKRYRGTRCAEPFLEEREAFFVFILLSEGPSSELCPLCFREFVISFLLCTISFLLCISVGSFSSLDFSSDHEWDKQHLVDRSGVIEMNNQTIH